MSLEAREALRALFAPPFADDGTGETGDCRADREKPTAAFGRLRDAAPCRGRSAFLRRLLRLTAP